MIQIESTLNRISKRHGPWPAARSAINDSLEFEGPRFQPEVRDRLTALAETLQPVTLIDQLRLLISVPSWEHQKGIDGHYVDMSQVRAEALADKLAAERDNWFEYLPLLLQGRTASRPAFGNRLAKGTGDPWLFINSALSDLRAIPKEKRNGAVLAGFLSGVTDRSVVTAVLERIKNDPELLAEIVELTRLTKPVKEDLARLVSLLQSGTIAVERLAAFAYNSVLDHLPADEVIRFCQSLGGSSPVGPIYGFHILYMDCLHRNDRWDSCRLAFHNLLSNEGVVDEIHKDSMLAHAWQETMAKLLTSGPRDDELAIRVTKAIVKSAASEKFSYGANHYITPILTILFTKYFESAWPIFGAALISDD